MSLLRNMEVFSVWYQVVYKMTHYNTYRNAMDIIPDLRMMEIQTHG